MTVARRRDMLGVSALVLGVAGIGLGVAATRETWFVVGPLGLFTVILGLIDLDRAARRDPAAHRRTAVLVVVAGVVALGLGAWGTHMFLDELNQLIE